MTQPYWQGKKVLITGATGFIGKALEAKLFNAGAAVWGFGSALYNLEDAQAADLLLDSSPRLDHIFHLASWTKPGAFCLYHSAEQYHKNTLMHVNLLRAWHAHQPQAKLTCAGTSCAYPGHLADLHETDYWAGEPHESLLAYAMTKRMLYAGQLAYEKQYGLKSIHTIFATVYGPNDYFDEERSHCASALIQRFCLAAHLDLPSVTVWGDGTQEREFVYIDDQVHGLMLAAERLDSGLLNLGSGVKTTIKALAEMIAAACNYRGRIIYDPTKFVGIKTKALNISKAKSLIGWAPAIDVEEGIRRTVTWYNEYRLEVEAGEQGQ